MRPKYKMTAFSRIIIFMILFSPLAYMGAHYYQGEDGIAKLRNLFQQQDQPIVQTKIEQKQEEIERLNAKIISLENEIAQLKSKK